MVRRNLQPDTQLNWTAIAELARHVGSLADPLRATLRLDPAPWELLTRPQDPRDRLAEYLGTWATMDEAAWPEANVRALYDDIMDLFRDHPEADAWFRRWRAAHSEVRLS
jgi:hypothetical protein